MAEHADRITEIARELLADIADADAPVDLAADFTTRYPLAVVCDVLGVPADRVDQAATACRRMFSDDPREVGMAMAAFGELGAAALAGGRDGLAAQLRTRVPEDITDDQLHYLLFGLIFAGQITTDAALGFLLARLLDGELEPDADQAAIDAFVRESCGCTRRRRSRSGGSPRRSWSSPGCRCRRGPRC